MNKRVAVVFTVGIMLAMIVSPANSIKASSKTIIVPDDYPTITAAIGNATSGDVIFVRNGTYQEQVLDISKSLSVIGENVNTTKIILHPPPIPPPDPLSVFQYEDPIKISSDNVVLSSFTITADGGDISAVGTGIQIDGNNMNIGVSATGDGLQILGNNVNMARNYYLRIAANGSRQTIAQNTLTGAYIECNGALNKILENKITLPFQYFGIILSYDSYNLILENTIVNGGLELKEASNNNVIAKNNMDSLSIILSYNNTVCGNNITGNLWFEGSYNIFYGNYMQSISIGNYNIDASGTFYQNDFDFAGGTSVRIGYGVHIPLALDNGTMGNYWSNYIGEDGDGDDIGDAPYVVHLARDDIDGCYRYVEGYAGTNPTLTLTDHYPLMAPFNITTVNVTLPDWTTSLPSITPIPTFPPAPTPSPSPFASPTPTPSPSIPEFPSWIILLLFAAVTLLFVALKKSRDSLQQGFRAA